jgi:hypothetical protein
MITDNKNNLEVTSKSYKKKTEELDPYWKYFDDSDFDLFDTESCKQDLENQMKIVERKFKELEMQKNNILNRINLIETIESFIK